MDSWGMPDLHSDRHGCARCTSSIKKALQQQRALSMWANVQQQLHTKAEACRHCQHASPGWDASPCAQQ